MSKLKAEDNYGHVAWCNWRKPLNDPTWAGCGHWALQSVPAGTCDRLFDPQRLKLCTSGSGQAAVGGAAVGARSGVEIGRTFGPEGVVPGVIAGAVIGTAVSPIMNAATNNEACTAVNTFDTFADADAYCAIPKGLKNNPTMENAHKFGLSCIGKNGNELTPVSTCSSIKLEDFDDEDKAATKCRASWTMGEDDGEQPYLGCQWLSFGERCTINHDVPCTFDWNVMRTANGDNFSGLRALETDDEKYTYCDYNNAYGSYAPECPAENNSGCPLLNRHTYDFETGTDVIYCGKDNNPVKCADSPSKVDALLIGSNSELASCPCGYTEDGFVENPDNDDCVGLDIGGDGFPCTYRKCNLIVPTDH